MLLCSAKVRIKTTKKGGEKVHFVWWSGNNKMQYEESIALLFYITLYCRGTLSHPHPHPTWKHINVYSEGFPGFPVKWPY